MSDYNLGTARGVIEIEYKGDGARRASQDLNRAGSSAEDANQKMGSSGTKLAATGAVIAAGLGLAVKSAASFEKRLSAVKAVSGASAEEMEQVRKKSLQLGKDTAFSASESATAIEELVKAGVSIADVMNGAADATVALAAAGGVDLPTAATIASNSMNQFGLAAKDMPRVADLIAGAANASAIDVGDFGMAISQAGAVAKLAGLSFEDTATAIALFGNAGIKGSDAGTSLKSMLMQLTPENERAWASFEKLGLVSEEGTSKFYDAGGKMKSLAEISGLLADGIKDMSEQERKFHLKNLFGSDGIRAASILADQGATGFEKMAASMNKVKAADVAADRLDNLDGAMEQLKGSLETLMIQIGTPLLGLLTGIVKALTEVMDVVLRVPAPILEAAVAFTAMVAAGLMVVGAVMKIISVVKAGGAVMTLLTGPVGWVIAAIAALVAAFIYFYRTSATFRSIIKTIGDAIKTGLAAAIEYIVPLLQRFGAFAAMVFTKLAGLVSSALGPAFRDLLASFLDFASSVRTALGPTIQFAVAVFGVLVTLFTSVVLPLLMKVGAIFMRVFVVLIGSALRTALSVIRGVLNIIAGVFKVFSGILTGNWNKTWAGIKQIVRGAVQVVVAIMRNLLRQGPAIIRALGSLLLAGIKAIPGLLRGAGGLFMSAGRFLIQQFANGMRNAAGIIEGIASNVWNFVRGLLNGAISRINAALTFTISLPGKNLTINPPDIPALATGGVTNGAMLALIGDNPGGQEVVSPLDELWRQMEKIYKAGLSAGTVAETASQTSRAGSAPRQSLGSRIVSGRLSLDPSGVAFIRGIAEDVVDDNERFHDMTGRMG